LVVEKERVNFEKGYARRRVVDPETVDY
jgi:hypothetical protein